MAKFEEIYAINVNDKTEKKGNLTYLSWAFAWAEFKKVYPEVSPSETLLSQHAGWAM